MATPDRGNGKTADEVVALLHTTNGARDAIERTELDRLDDAERARVWATRAVKLANGLHLPGARYGVPIDLVVELQRQGLTLIIACPDDALRSSMRANLANLLYDEWRDWPRWLAIDGRAQALALPPCATADPEDAASDRGDENIDSERRGAKTADADDKTAEAETTMAEDVTAGAEVTVAHDLDHDLDDDLADHLKEEAKENADALEARVTATIDRPDLGLGADAQGSHPGLNEAAEVEAGAAAGEPTDANLAAIRRWLGIDIDVGEFVFPHQEPAAENSPAPEPGDDTHQGGDDAGDPDADRDGDERVGDERGAHGQAQTNTTDTGSDADRDRGRAGHRDGGNDGLDRAQIERVARFRREFVVGPDFVASHVQALQKPYPEAERLADGLRLAAEDGTPVTITISEHGDLNADGGPAAASKALETYTALLQAGVDDVEYLRLAVRRVGLFEFDGLSQIEQVAGKTGMARLDVDARLPELEMARTLVAGLSAADSDEGNDKDNSSNNNNGEETPETRLRRRLRAAPQRFFQPPLFGALITLRLESDADWSHFVAMAGSALPNGLKRRTLERMKEVQAQRRARAQTQSPGAGMLELEAGPDFEKLCDRVGKDPAQALTAEALDIMLGLLAKAHKAREQIRRMIAMGFAQDQAASQLANRVAAFVSDLFDRLRQKGARIGLLEFRLALARHAGGGNKVEALLEREAILPPSWRLRLVYDEDHPDEMADFCGEIAASLPNVFYTDHYVSIAWSIGSETALMHELTAHTLVEAIERRLNFEPNPDMRERSLPRRIGRTLVERGASADRETMTRATSERRLDGMRLPRILRGFASCPILRPDGAIVCTEGGYDAETGTLVVDPPRIAVPERPTLAEALDCRQLLRKFFDTFQHQGEGDPKPDALGILHNDLGKPPGHGENAALALLLTMIVRCTLPIVPRFLLHAASDSGAGAGKGLEVRVCTLIAHGHDPYVVMPDKKEEENEKRLVGALIAGAPVIMLDNWNGMRIDSNTIMTVISEVDPYVRPLGQSPLVRVARTVLTITGNDTSMAADNVNRFVDDVIDPRVEDPEERPFDKLPNIQEEALRRRSELLGAAFTLLRYSAQHRDDERAIPRGRSCRFPQWARLVRDVLMLGGGADLLARHDKAKANDPHRQWVAEVFATWWEHHGDSDMTAAELHYDIRSRFTDGDGLPLKNNQLGKAVSRLEGTRREGWHLANVTPEDPRKSGHRPRAQVWRLEWTGPADKRPPRGNG